MCQTIIFWVCEIALTARAHTAGVTPDERKGLATLDGSDASPTTAKQSF